MSDSATSTASSNGAEPPHHTEYRLRVTAGPAYDPSTHKIVPVNSPETLTFENDHIILSLAYSISFSFVPKVDIPGSDLVFGNDFDRPLRDRLPPGVNQALKIVKWWIDPGLDGDVYADKPYLYGPALSSWNFLRIGDKIVKEDELKDKNAWKIPNATSFHETVVEEGADGSGEEVRKDDGIPADAAARKKHFLTQAHRDAFVFEAGRLYQADFGNPYLDFNDFSMKLPGFSLNVLKYIDAKTHELRYTLKNKATDEVYAAVLFTLLFGEELEKIEKEQGKANVDEDKDKDKDGASKDAGQVPSNDDDDVD
ncbi:hypothetical protein LTR44_009450 [Exophiala sp. CCFEE 6388]|nr:hypothetical protein LTR44_009450 [Eurotiomycetes sp. CCFEE 6388]